MTTTLAVGYRTGFCAVGAHGICPVVIRCNDSLSRSCGCDCHTQTPPAAAEGETRPSARHNPDPRPMVVAAALGRFA